MKKSRFLRASAVTLVLALLLSLAACSGSGDNGGSAGSNDGGDGGANVSNDGGSGGSDSGEAGGGEAWLIGFNTWGAGTPTFDVMGDETAYTIKLYGGEYSRVSDENMADKELANIQNFVSADVDGIVMQTAAEPVLPQAAEACKAAGIPFCIPTFVGLEEDRAEISATNEYYVGSVEADLYMDGYLMGKAAADDGHKTVVLLGGNIGDINFEKRIEGFEDAFVKEGGGEVIDAARCTSPAEGQEKCTALLSANQDVDCVYAMVGDYGSAAIAAEDTLGLDMPIYVSNANKDDVPYIKDGRIAAAAGGNDLASNIAVALLFNYLDGHPILDENGKAPELKIDPFLVTIDNVEDFETYFYADNQHPFTEEVLKSLVWRFNPDVSYSTFTDLIENGLTLEALVADHQ